MKTRLINLLKNFVYTITDLAGKRHRSNFPVVDSQTVSLSEISVCVTEIIRQGIDLGKSSDPRFIVKMVHEAIKPAACQIKEVKAPVDRGDPMYGKFERLLSDLSDVPVFSAAEIYELVNIADNYIGNFSAGSKPGEDVSWVFRISSSFGTKARVLSCIVRYMKPRVAVEAGTCFGMSSVILMRAMEKYSGGGRLWTIELSQPQFDLASNMLKSRFGDRVECLFGFSSEKLPTAVEGAGAIDLFFHDAGHSKDDYVTDFGLVVDALAPGSVVIIDDITWWDSRFVPQDPECYAGWQSIVSHERVKWAVELDSDIGLALVGP